MNYESAYALIVSQVASFGASALIVLTAIVAVGIGLLVFRWGWSYFNFDLMHDIGGKWDRIPGGWRQRENLPGSVGYDSMRGSGASAGNRARMESDGPGGGRSLI